MSVAWGCKLLAITALCASLCPAHAQEARGKKKLFALAGAVAFEQTANWYDTRETERGLRAGVAIEGNTWLLSNDHPSARALYARDAFTVTLVSVPSVLAYVFRRKELYYAGLAGPTAFGFKHIQGGRAWAKLLREAGK